MYSKHHFTLISSGGRYSNTIFLCREGWRSLFCSRNACKWKNRTLYHISWRRNSASKKTQSNIGSNVSSRTRS